MSLGQLLLLNFMAGIGVAAAVYLSTSARRPLERWAQIIGALLFWPLYLPLLLSYRAEPQEARIKEPQPTAPPNDELSLAIAQVDAELQSAWRNLDGWAEDVLAREKDRLGELRNAWATQARRVREMDRLLAQPESPALTAGASVTGLADRMQSSQQVVRQNRCLLQQVRDRTLQELLGTMAWMRELVSMIHLAKFTGAPASRAEELVAQIAAAVEGLSALTWQEESEGRAGGPMGLQIPKDDTVVLSQRRTTRDSLYTSGQFQASERTSASASGTV